MASYPAGAVRLFALLLLHACGGDATTDPGESGTGPTLVEVLAGQALVDTVGAKPDQAVVARVVRSDGLPIANREVIVSVPRTAPGVWLRASEDDRDSGELVLTSDGQGEFRFLVTLRTVAGRAMVEMRPSGGFAATKQIFVEILPGEPVEATLEPVANLATVGDSVRLVAAILDQHGNAVPGDVELSVSGPATVARQRVVGTDPGKVVVVAEAGAFADSAEVTVVPEGRMVFTSSSYRIRSMKLDATQQRAMRFILGTPDLAADPLSDGAVFGAANALWVTDFSEFRQVTGSGPFQVASRPRFAPDGALVYFMADFGNERVEVWRISLDGGSTLEQVTEASEGQRHRFPSPSNDGTRLLYASTTGSSPGGPLVLVDLEGGGEILLGVEGQSSRWSPDDEWIAYLDAGAELRRIRPDGSDDQAILPGLEVHTNFAWTSDGRFLVASEPSGVLVLVEVASGQALPIPIGHPVYGLDVHPGS